jgi:hypothetical protein
MRRRLRSRCRSDQPGLVELYNAKTVRARRAACFISIAVGVDLVDAVALARDMACRYSAPMRSSVLGQRPRPVNELAKPTLWVMGNEA